MLALDACLPSLCRMPELLPSLPSPSQWHLYQLAQWCAVVDHCRMVLPACVTSENDITLLGITPGSSLLSASGELGSTLPISSSTSRQREGVVPDPKCLLITCTDNIIFFSWTGWVA